MRLTTYVLDGRPAAGVCVDDLVVPLTGSALGIGEHRPDLRDIISRWDELGSKVRAAAGAGVDGEPVANLDDAHRWLPPVQPRSIFAVGLNNDRLSAQATRIPQHPIVFSYPTSALTGHLSPIEIRAEYGLTHPEPELAVVIGTPAKAVTVEQAMDTVFGYTVLDDVTSVDLKSDDTVVFPASFTSDIGGKSADPGAPAHGYEWSDVMTLTYHARSKGCDTFAPCGPWIVTKDEVADPHDLDIRMSIDGEDCTEDNTSRLVHRIPEVLAYITRYFTLQPGDLVHMGTAARGRYRLRDIDYQTRKGLRVIDVAGVGRLANPIIHL